MIAAMARMLMGAAKDEIIDDDRSPTTRRCSGCASFLARESYNNAQWRRGRETRRCRGCFTAGAVDTDRSWCVVEQGQE